ncbi:uncharacterized protein [Dermacentor andersoni]|uniref:uncharacterized protein n=1 Tax=Dermacentor andersoni TaxID=34620 RepID=UPI002417D0DA|nr:uncharacterized protein LOC129381885 [Dermacentor andersoni]
MPISLGAFSAATAGRRKRFFVPSQDYQVILPSLPTERIVLKMILVHAEVSATPYRFEAPVGLQGFYQNQPYKRLGAAHDGEGASANCPATDRHLMTPFHQLRKPTFSLCSLASINAFLKTPEAICLFGQANTGKSRVRPVLDENPQLLQQRREACQSCLSECQHIESIKTKRPCYFRCTISNRNKKGAPIEYYRYDQDGTPCSIDDPFKKCKNGKCQ